MRRGRARCRIGGAAGCPIPSDRAKQYELFSGAPCLRPTGALINGRLDNAKLLLEHAPGKIAIDFPGSMATFMMTFLHVVAGNDRQHQRATLEWLLANGGAAVVPKRWGFGFSTLGTFAANPDADVELLDTLWAADPAFHAMDVNANGRPLKVVRRMIFVLSLLAKVSSTFKTVHAMFTEMMVAGTPLHIACFMGYVPMVKALLAKGADPTIRTRADSPACPNMTAFEVVLHKHAHSDLPAAIEREIRAAGYGDEALCTRLTSTKGAGAGAGPRLMTHPQVMPAPHNQPQ